MYEFIVRHWENNGWFARGCVLAKHAKGFQQVLMGRESQDALSLFTLASKVETTKKLLWLRTIFRPDIIDDDHQSIYTSAG